MISIVKYLFEVSPGFIEGLANKYHTIANKLSVSDNGNHEANVYARRFDNLADVQRSRYGQDQKYMLTPTSLKGYKERKNTNIMGGMTKNENTRLLLRKQKETINNDLNRQIFV